MTNALVEGFTGIKFAVHLCRRAGARVRGEKHHAGTYGLILPQLNRLKVQHLTIEFTVAGEEDLESLGRLRGDFELGLGVVDVASGASETPEQIAARVERALQRVDANRITLSIGSTTTMIRRAHAAVLVMITAGTLYPLLACADMYVWTDETGMSHISNLPPPPAGRLVSVTRAAPKDPEQDAALRETARQAEMRALNERVQQLEAEIQQAQLEPPPAIITPQPTYAPPQPAPNVIVVSPPPAPSHPQPVVGCEYGWNNCANGFWPGFYPTNVVVLRHVGVRHHPAASSRAHEASWPPHRIASHPLSTGRAKARPLAEIGPARAVRR